MWLEIIQLALPDWNKRVLTELDFFEFCEQERLKVVEAYTGENGLYVVYRGEPFIMLDPEIKGGLRYWVEWHEAAHHLLHVPATSFFGIESLKSQWQANVVAACALMPLSLLKVKSISEIHEEYAYPKPLYQLRARIFERYRF
jgi:hypothetical protein